MLSYVTTPVTGWNIQATFNDTTATITSASSTATTSTVSFTGSGVTRVLPKSNYILAEAGDQVVLNLSVSGLDSAMTFRIRTAGTNTNAATSAIVDNGDNQDITFNLTGSAGYPHFTATASSGGATVTINSVTVNGKSGFVETWYDQSGNNNNAVQSAAANQPKIVSAGSLVSDGIEFDGTNDVMAFSSDVISNVNNASTFVVAKSTHPTGFTITNGVFISNTPVYSSPTLVFGSFFVSYAGSSIDVGAHDNNVNLFSAVTGSTDGGGNELIEAFRNGVSKGTLSATSGFSSPGSFGLGAGTYKGTFQEVIIYDSDQNLNREAIEANVNNHYSIF